VRLGFGIQGKAISDEKAFHVEMHNWYAKSDKIGMLKVDVYPLIFSFFNIKFTMRIPNLTLRTFLVPIIRKRILMNWSGTGKVVQNPSVIPIYSKHFGKNRSSIPLDGQY